MLSEKRSSMLHGVLLITLFSCAAFYIGDMDFVKSLSLSPMIVGIVLGMLYANSLRNNLPDTWVPGIQFCSKRVLRFGIILYGFRLTFQNVLDVGLPAILIDAIVVTLTICGGVLVGKLLKMDKDIALLASVGSGICGAAAVLGAESAIKAKPYKTAVAVSTVVIFGTLAMFVYPVLYRNGVFDLNPQQMGIYTGSTVHEVAHVVGAGNAMGPEVSNSAIIVKMIRVMMLVPVLLVISFFMMRAAMKSGEGSSRGKINMPWFAILFLVVIAFNSFDLLPAGLVDFINTFDTFLLTMAMTALGAETSIDKFRKAGFKPFVLAFILFIWLMGGGYCLAKYVVPMLG
ncbi:MAG: YeiH family protein [Bacteroidales bacterium]|nr:YeiH family protein [Bacteroidales bacterium]MDD6897781.1 YeiH family protein [Bacteroidales bacterium]MDY2692062.1 YeiH family protein [Prevotella sp.]MDY4732433.1 YeiH family protein [Prevotella sp.]MDY6027998.1 YeiH family protein [Prevotella sp.]